MAAVAVPASTTSTSASASAASTSSTATTTSTAPRRYSSDRYRSSRPSLRPRLILHLPSTPLTVSAWPIHVTGPSSLGQSASRRRRLHFYNPSISAAPSGLCPRCAYVATLRADVLHQCDASSPLYGEEGLPRALATNGERRPS